MLFEFSPLPARASQGEGEDGLFEALLAWNNAKLRLTPLNTL
jgi:hypothetical protein